MVDCGGLWWIVMAYGGLWWLVVACDGLWGLMVACGGLWWLMEAYVGLWWLTVAYGGLWWLWLSQPHPKFGVYSMVLTGEQHAALHNLQAESCSEAQQQADQRTVPVCPLKAESCGASTAAG